MRIVIVAGLTALALAAAAPSANADIGPIDPARKICMGLAEGTACTIDGKAGSCHGPHPSRMYCQAGQPPSQGSGSADTGSVAEGGESGSAAGSAQPAAGSAQPVQDPAPTPGHKRGCEVTDPGSATLVGLVLAVLGVRRRRRSRSMS